MAFDLKKYRDENAHWYGDSSLEDVAKDVYSRGGDEYHGGIPYEEWTQKAGIADQLQKDAEEQQKATIQRQKQDAIANRGIIGGLASDVAGGLVDYGELGMRAVRAVSPEGSWLERKATEGIEGINKFKEESPFLASPEESPDTGFFSMALHGGVRSAAQSVAAGLPSALAGAAMGSAAGPVGTAIGAVAGNYFIINPKWDGPDSLNIEIRLEEIYNALNLSIYHLESLRELLVYRRYGTVYGVIRLNSDIDKIKRQRDKLKTFIEAQISIGTKPPNHSLPESQEDN